MVSPVSVETALERRRGAGMVFDMSPW